MTWEGFVSICKELRNDRRIEATGVEIRVVPRTGETIIPARSARRGKVSWMENIFTHCFETMSWNLMARSHNVGVVTYGCMGWENDCLFVHFAKTKKDHKGKKKHKAHVFANPLQPAVCPILSLAIYVLCTQDTRRNQLFTGQKSEGRFSKALKRLLTEIPELKTVIPNVNDIGTHSNRKGSVSFVLMYVVISVVAVYLRAGWSLGNTQDRYIHGGPGADQLVGRAVCGLPVNGIEFSTLAPHFKSSAYNFIQRDIRWENIIDNYDKFPVSFKAVLPFLIASIIYHHDYLVSTLEANHPLFHTKVFTSIISINGVQKNLIGHYKNEVITGIGSCADTGMTASGIPPHLAHSYELNLLRQEVRNAKTEILAYVESLPDKLAAHLLRNFNVNGVVPVTMDHINALRQELLEAILNIGRILPLTAIPTAPTNQSAAIASGFQFFTWPNEMGGRVVPHDFKFPSLPAKQLWNHWHFGDAAKNIRPYSCFITRKDDMNGRNAKHNRNFLTKAAALISCILKSAEQLNLIPSNTTMLQLGMERSEQIFDQAFNVLIMSHFGGDKFRPNSVFTTLYNKLKLTNSSAASVDNQNNVEDAIATEEAAV